MFTEAKRRFLQAKAVDKSPRTVVNYREAIDQFTGWFLAPDPTRDLGDVCRDDVRAFLLYLRERGRCGNTVANRFRTLRNFFNWCTREKILRTSPAKGLQEPRVNTNAVTPFTPDEIDRMLVATRRMPQSALRDQTIIAILYNTGIRAGELCTLKPETVREGGFKVVGKGHRERWIGLEAVTQRMLMTYMLGRDDRYVFNISVGGLYRIIRRLASEANPPVPNAYTHRFRDTYACAFLEAGGDVEQLQTQLGHANIDTTLRYVLYNRAQRAIDAQRRFAPFAVRARERARERATA